VRSQQLAPRRSEKTPKTGAPRGQFLKAHPGTDATPVEWSNQASNLPLLNAEEIRRDVGRVSGVNYFFVPASDPLVQRWTSGGRLPESARVGTSQRTCRKPIDQS
jgi:hypothetical protein